MSDQNVQKKLGLNREQLAKFLTNQEQIRQFELLFELANSITSVTVDLSAIEAQILAIQNAITIINAQIPSIQTAISNLQAALSSITSDIATLQDEVDVLESETDIFQGQDATQRGLIGDLLRRVEAIESQHLVETNALTLDLIRRVSSIESQVIGALPIYKVIGT